VHGGSRRPGTTGGNQPGGTDGEGALLLWILPKIGAWDMACRAEAVGGTGRPDHGEGGGMGPGASPNGLPAGYGVASGANR